ncbi:DUF6019 family protein [uncultured Pseudokineococcus sp.]
MSASDTLFAILLAVAFFAVLYFIIKWAVRDGIRAARHSDDR